MNRYLAAALSLAALAFTTTSAPAWWNQCGCCQESYSFNFCNWPCCAPPSNYCGNFGYSQGGGLPVMTLPPLPLPVSHNVLGYPPPSDYAPYARVSYAPFAHTPEYGYDPGLEPPPPLPHVSITTPGHLPPKPKKPKQPKRPGWWNDVLPPCSPCCKACAPADVCKCCDCPCDATAAAKCASSGKKRLHLRLWKKAKPCGSSCEGDCCSTPDTCASCDARPARQEGACSCNGPGYLPPPSPGVNEQIAPACAQVVVAEDKPVAPKEKRMKRFCRNLVFKPASWPQPELTPPLCGPGRAPAPCPCGR
jgi:hypothetical protein